MSEADGTLRIAGRTYNIVTLDYETFYGDHYTLSGPKGLSTSEYVRDPRFHAHGVGIKDRFKKTKWVMLTNILVQLHAIDWKNAALLAHNTAFDGFILSQVYDIKPAFYLDTLSMSRAAHGAHTTHNLNDLAKRHGLAGKTKADNLKDTKNKTLLTAKEAKALGEYCIDDVNDTYSVFWKLYPHIPDSEMLLIDITLRMFCDPVLGVDIPRVQAELERETRGKVTAVNQTDATVEELMSNDKFAAKLKAHGETVPMKTSKSTGKPTYAFAKSDLDFQKLLLSKNPMVVSLAEARLKVKSTIGETRANRFLEAGKDGARLPVLLNYAAAHTFRWSGGNKMNMQNLKRGGELRRSILAPKGHMLVVMDSAQIEARKLVWLAGQEDMVAAFAEGKDTYKMMASSIYGIPVEQIGDDSDERFIGKVCVLGLGYGMGARRLQLTLAQGIMGPKKNLPLEECYRIVNIYRSKNFKVVQLWKKFEQIVHDMRVGNTGSLGPISWGKNFIRMPNGLFMQYHGLHGEIVVTDDDMVRLETKYLTARGKTKIYGGLLVENVVQSLARCAIGEQMVEIGKDYRIVTMTHDEIVACVPANKAEKCLKDMKRIMSKEPAWAPGLPLSAKGGYDVNYSK